MVQSKVMGVAFLVILFIAQRKVGGDGLSIDLGSGYGLGSSSGNGYGSGGGAGSGDRESKSEYSSGYGSSRGIDEGECTTNVPLFAMERYKTTCQH